MARLSRLWRNLTRRREVEREVHDELHATFELLVEEGIERGLTREDAARAARLELGSIPAIEDHIRDVQTGASLRHLLRDLRHAARTTVKRPGIPLLVVLAFGLGSAGVTTTFALVHGILLAPLPYPGASRIVTLKHAAPGLGLAEAGLSTGTYFHYRDHASSFESIAVYSETVLNLSDPGAASERVNVTHAGRPFFDVLGVRPALGRGFTAEDEAPGFRDTRWAIPVILSHDFWTRRFGGDAAVVERTIALGGRPRKVVGVMPAGFSFPRRETQIWMLNKPPEGSGNFAARLDYDAIARLRPGVEAAAAARELERLLPAIEGAYPDATAERLAHVKLAPVVVPLKDEVTRDVRGLLWLVFGASGALLLVACANAAALLLLRAEGRSREMAVRIALGARRVDVARLFFSDAILYSTAAAACGVPVAHVAIEAVVAFTPIPLPRLAEVGLDWQVFAFTFLVAALGTCVFGAVSFLRTSALASKAAVLPIASGPPDPRRAGRARSLLVAVQVAVALSLLVGSALMVQSF